MTKMTRILHAYAELIKHDLFMARHDFAALALRVRDFPLQHKADQPTEAEHIAFALDVACCFYPKQTLCLQRSAVLVKLLRHNGIPAQMVIGAQKLPFKAHAWVEVHGQIINDRLASRERFLVLEVF